MSSIKVKSFIISYIISFLYLFLFFENFIFSLLASSVSAFLARRIIYNFLLNKNNMEKRMMFREFLDIFNASILSGSNFYEALKSAREEMITMFTGKNPMCRAVDRLIRDLDNSLSVEEALESFSKDLAIDEVYIFCQSLSIGFKSGINIGKLVFDSKESITESIALNLELDKIISAGKREFLIIAFLPIAVLFVLSFTIGGSLNFIDYIIRIPMFLLIVFAVNLAYKIVNLEV